MKRLYYASFEKGFGEVVKKVIKKTTFKGLDILPCTVNLAIALSEMGYRVVVIDADLGLANIDVMLGMMPKYNLLDVIKNDKSTD